MIEILTFSYDFGVQHFSLYLDIVSISQRKHLHQQLRISSWNTSFSRFNMSEFDQNMSDLVKDLHTENLLVKVSLRILFPVWFGMMFYIIWALVGKLESVSDFWHQQHCIYKTCILVNYKSQPPWTWKALTASESGVAWCRASSTWHLDSWSLVVVTMTSMIKC